MCIISHYVVAKAGCQNWMHDKYKKPGRDRGSFLGVGRFDVRTDTSLDTGTSRSRTCLHYILLIIIPIGGCFLFSTFTYAVWYFFPKII